MTSDTVLLEDGKAELSPSSLGRRLLRLDREIRANGHRQIQNPDQSTNGTITHWTGPPSFGRCPDLSDYPEPRTPRVSTSGANRTLD